jgi:hypothetical protein
MAIMAANPRATRCKEYNVFTLLCIFDFFYVFFFFSVVAKLKIVTIEGGNFIKF